MQNRLNLLTACVLMTACAVLAQQGFESVEGIMEELMNYTGESAVEVEETFSIVDDEVIVAEPVTLLDETVEIDDEPIESAPVVENNTELFEGDFVTKTEGLAGLAAIAPETNIVDRMYPRALMEREQRNVEVDGLDAVDAAWSTEQVLRSYKLASGASERMRLGEETAAVSVEELFPQVDFPKGSSAIYQPGTHTVFIKNTRENLAVLETMMETMGVLEGFEDADQVEIEAKFVEVAEGTLESLGFQWDFENLTYPSTDSLFYSGHPDGGGTDLGGVIVGDNIATLNSGNNPDFSITDDGLFRRGLRGGVNYGEIVDNNGDTIMPGFTKGTVPFSQTPVGDGVVSASGDWSSFRFVDTFSSETPFMGLTYDGGSYDPNTGTFIPGDNPINLLISALDQSSGTDVLSAPRVLTRSGEEATIQVGQLHYFPEVYEGSATPTTMLAVEYADFIEQLLGVELTVSPVVNEDRDIQLELNPRITELAGWQSYQLAPANYLYGHYQGGIRPRGYHDTVLASLPIIKKREIKTTVTIADGSTIGMGGLISEKIEAYEDRVPVMGSLPLVGRLFRTEGERAVKRNLLMFVTAKIIEPNGRIDTSRSFE